MSNTSSSDWDTFDAPTRTETPDLGMPVSDEEYVARLAGAHWAAGAGVSGWFNRVFAGDDPLTPSEVAIFVALAGGSTLLFLFSLVYVLVG